VEKPAEMLATQASHFRNSYELFVLHCTDISEEKLMLITLRTVPPFVTTHTFSASPDIRISSEICPSTQQYLLYFCVEKADLSKGYQNPG